MTDENRKLWETLKRRKVQRLMKEIESVDNNYEIGYDICEK